MLFLSLALAVSILLTANAIARYPRGLGVAAVVSPLLGLLATFLTCGWFPELLAAGSLIGVAACACLALRRRRRLFPVLATIALILTYAVDFVLVLTPTPELTRLRERYPVESMAERLAFERRRLAAANLSDAAALVPPGEGLTTLEEEINRSANDPFLARERSLALLHERTVADFISRPGTGIIRGFRPSLDHIELTDPEPIPLPAARYDPDRSLADAAVPEPDSLPAGNNSAAAAPAREGLSELHLDSVVDFVNARGFGLIEDREHVRGFHPHQFKHMPVLPSRGTRPWRVHDLQLVSLLKHAEPVVYVSEHLPRMQDLAKVSTRPLDSFERRALAVLQKGANLETQVGFERLRMLGSIRAVKQCLQCHEVPRGFLLGAFSYELRTESDAPER